MVRRGRGGGRRRRPHAGHRNGLFSPGGSVSRGMAAAILYRLAGEPAAPEIPFSDVTAADYYGAAVAWAAESGVVTGYADGTFRPQLPVSRQQLAALLWRYADWADIDLVRPADLTGYRTPTTWRPTPWSPWAGR